MSKVVLITGATGGLGKAVAEHLSQALASFALQVKVNWVKARRGMHGPLELVQQRGLADASLPKEHDDFLPGTECFLHKFKNGFSTRKALFPAEGWPSDVGVGNSFLLAH